ELKRLSELKRLPTNSKLAARGLSSAFSATGECVKPRQNVIKFGHIGRMQKTPSPSVDQSGLAYVADMLIPRPPPPPIVPPVPISTLDGGCANPICIQP
ncbi:hypothetical protein AAVH_40901, partial [Aphelenchoides avenae]